MGRGIAVVLASAGHVVEIIESDESAATSLTERFAAEVKESATGSSDAETTFARIHVGMDLEHPTRSARLVVEAVPERLDVKVPLWQRIGELAAPDAILATNTSSFDINAFAALVPSPERVLGTHWFNPAILIPCVEVVRGSATSDAVVDSVCAILRAAKKAPVIVRNSPGFVANRIQFALIREAMLCLEEGLATAEDIDTIVSSSFGPRLAALGPLAIADLGGLDTYRSILTFLSSTLSEQFTVPTVLDELVSTGRLGTKTLSGIFDYTDESAQDLIDHRDATLRRVINAARTETGAIQ